MNRVCSMIVALSLMSSMLMAQTSPTVPIGHWAYDVFKELADAGLVHLPSGLDAKTAYTREQGATVVIDAMDSIRKMLEAQPDLRNISRVEVVMSASKDRDRYQAISDDATRLYKQVAKVKKLSIEFQDELLARSIDVVAFNKLCSDTEKATVGLEIALLMIPFKQHGPEVDSDHWAYDAVRLMITDGVLTGYRMPTKQSGYYTTVNLFARMIMSVPAVLNSKVAEHEASVKL